MWVGAVHAEMWAFQALSLEFQTFSFFLVLQRRDYFCNISNKTRKSCARLTTDTEPGPRTVWLLDHVVEHFHAVTSPECACCNLPSSCSTTSSTTGSTTQLLYQKPWKFRTFNDE